MPKAKKHLFAVTDPCYLAEDRDDKVWNEFCNLLSHPLCGGTPEADKYLSEALGIPIKAERTGFGDWRNDLIGEDVQASGFTADSGMVCVAEITKKLPISRRAFDRLLKIGLIAVFECDHAFDELDIIFDTGDPAWTVLHVSYQGKELVRSCLLDEEDEDGCDPESD